MLRQPAGVNISLCIYRTEGNDRVINGRIFYSGNYFEVVESYGIPGTPAVANIVRNEYLSLYYVQEPELDDLQRSILCMIMSALPEIVMSKRKIGRINTDIIKDIIVKSVEDSTALDKSSIEKISYYILRDTTGYGTIDPLIRDPEIEDVSCSGPEMPIYVYHRSYGNLMTNRTFKYGRQLDNFVVSLAQKGGKMITASEPILDSTTPEGHRVSATLGKEVTSRGSSFSIRLFRNSPLTPVDLIRTGTATSELMAFLWLAVETRRNILVIGESGAGKTTTLNAVSFFIPPWSKLVSIEEVRELNIPHRNWIPAVTRGISIGEREQEPSSPDVIDMFDLLRMALRHRPEYLIIGEIRGREAYSLFQAMSTGQTTLATIHADSLQSLINRLENPPLSIPTSMLSSIDILVKVSQAKFAGKVGRRISAVTAMGGLSKEYGDISAQGVFEWDQREDKIRFLYPRPYMRILSKQIGLEESELINEISNRANFLSALLGKTEQFSRPQDIFSIIHSFRYQPKERGGD
ncbi:MAG: type II/IV secretion system ATPase subunit [Thermoplasmatales archaeon]